MKIRLVVLLSLITGSIVWYSCQQSPTEAGSSTSTATITGTVSYNNQGIPNIKIVDMNSANRTAYYSDASGGFTMTLQLTGQYTAFLVFTDTTAKYKTDTVTFTIDPGATKSLAVTLTQDISVIRTARQVSVISISIDHIYSKGVGLLEGNSQLENCKYVLQVKDSAGVAIASTPTYKAKFSLNFYPAVGAYGSAPSVSPDSTSTDENGQLQVTISSGTCPGTVQMVVQVALADGNSFKTYITRLNIYSGFADQSHFFVMPTNSEGINGYIIPYWGSAQTHAYSATVADTFGYAVPSGHAVGFIATPGGPGKIGNNGISVTDADGNAGLTYWATEPSTSAAGFYTTTDPLTSGRAGYHWLQAQTMGKNGTYIKDSILILWNNGYIRDSLSAGSITMNKHTHSPKDTIYLWDSNGNPLNATISATVDLGSNTDAGLNFQAEGDISSDAITIPGGDRRLQGRGNTMFVFGMYDGSTVDFTGAVTIKISITCPNYSAGTVVVQVPVTIN